MPGEVQIPHLGESVTEGVIVRWIKGDGETVMIDEPLLELETDKASVELPAPRPGILRIVTPEGATVQVGDVVARIEEVEGRKNQPGGRKEQTDPAKTPTRTGHVTTSARQSSQRPPRQSPGPAESGLSPAVRRLVAEHDLDPSDLKGSGRGGRITAGDVRTHLDTKGRADRQPRVTSDPHVAERIPEAPAERGERTLEGVKAELEVERVPMTPLRRRIAERLQRARQEAAILTTFNEVDLSAVLDLRTRYKSRFAEAHGVSLGLMSFFARASIAALRDFPVLNAQIDGTDIVYSERVHLGVAVATDRGLVVPVLRNADSKSFAEIERGIEDLASRARANKLALDDLTGGTFSISNGGVYGSLLSTPLLNPPQSAILGMHRIQKRPVVVEDEVGIRPMMYVAVSYDHRLIDGAQAVTFLVRVKERLEDPSRLLLAV